MRKSFLWLVLICIWCASAFAAGTEVCSDQALTYLAPDYAEQQTCVTTDNQTGEITKQIHEIKVWTCNPSRCGTPVLLTAKGARWVFENDANGEIEITEETVGASYAEPDWDEHETDWVPTQVAQNDPSEIVPDLAGCYGFAWNEAMCLTCVRDLQLVGRINGDEAQDWRRDCQVMCSGAGCRAGGNVPIGGTTGCQCDDADWPLCCMDSENTGVQDACFAKCGDALTCTPAPECWEDCTHTPDAEGCDNCNEYCMPGCPGYPSCTGCIPSSCGIGCPGYPTCT